MNLLSAASLRDPISKGGRRLGLGRLLVPAEPEASSEIECLDLCVPAVRDPPLEAGEDSDGLVGCWVLTPSTLPKNSLTEDIEGLSFITHHGFGLVWFGFEGGVGRTA